MDVSLTVMLTQKRKVHFILLIIVFAFAACMALGLRAYLFGKLGYHSVLAGSMPNFVAVVLISLIYIIVKSNGKPYSPLKASVMGCSTMVFYELVQPLIQGRTFDWFDIAASFLGGLFTFCLLAITNKYTR